MPISFLVPNSYAEVSMHQQRHANTIRRTIGAGRNLSAMGRYSGEDRRKRSASRNRNDGLGSGLRVLGQIKRDDGTNSVTPQQRPAFWKQQTSGAGEI